jgi:large subunit ribosomal protein L1
MAKRKSEKPVEKKVEKKVVAKEVVEKAKVEVKETENTESKSAKTIKTRSKAYKAAKAKIDITKFYPLDKAIKLVQSTSLSKFDGKIEAHINTTLESGKIGEITFPHLKTKAKKAVIANEALLKDIQAGKIDFDILIATPAFMPKLLPLARVLGPKGLMPNPKNGTLTDKPEEALKKLAAAATLIQTEKKGTLVHQIIGQVSQPLKEIQANLEALIKLVNPVKIKKLTLCASMGPSVKVEIK